MLVQIAVIAAAVILGSLDDNAPMGSVLRGEWNALPWRFQNYESKKCLDTEWDGTVVTNDCNEELSQIWVPYSRLCLKNKNTGKCLQLSKDGQVSTEPCDGSSGQRWEIAHSQLGLYLRNFYFLCISDKIKAVECKPTAHLEENMLWVRTHPRT